MKHREFIYQRFLEAQATAVRQLAQHTDILEIMPLPPFPADHYLLHFKCRCLCGRSAAELEEKTGVTVGLAFPPDYLRTVEPAIVVTLLDRPTLWHPNVRFPHICVGFLQPGTGIVDLCHQLYEIITFQNYTTVHGLNPLAMEWALRNKSRLPLESRPLKRVDRVDAGVTGKEVVS